MAGKINKRKGKLPKVRLKAEICLLELVRTLVPVLGIALQVIILLHIMRPV